MILDEKQITLSKLAELFDNAYLDFEKNDNRIIVNENDINVLINIVTDRKRIPLLAFMTFSNRNTDNMLKIINKMNDDLILVRFSLNEPDDDGTTLVGDYSLSYEHGLIDRHLISSIKTFSLVFAHSREVGLNG